MIYPVIQIDEIDPDKVYITLADPSAVPPHLGFIVNQKYFSLSVKGARQKDVNEWLALLEKKGISVLMLDLLFLKKGMITSADARRVFESHGKVGVNVSCFVPIRQLLAEAGVQFQARVLPEMITEMEQNKVAFRFVSFGASNQYTMPDYTYSDVLDYIRRISNKDVHKR